MGMPINQSKRPRPIDFLLFASLQSNVVSRLKFPTNNPSPTKRVYAC